MTEEITYFSKRIYKRIFDKSVVNEIEHTTKIFNQAKFSAFKEELCPSSSLSTHLAIKNRFNLNTYYTNDAVRKAKAIISSQKELNKLYVNQTKENIKKVNKKITATKRQSTNYTKIKNSLIKGKLIIPKNMNYHLKHSGEVEKTNRKGKVLQAWENVYLFEHCYLEPKIKYLKANIGRFNFRLNRFKQKLDKLISGGFSVVFGTKKLFKQQYTKVHYQQNHRRWLNDFRKERYKEIYFSGRSDSEVGNYSAVYSPELGTFYFKSIDGKPTVLTNISFPYGQDLIEAYFANQSKNYKSKDIRKPISYSLEDHGLYYILKCSIEVTNETEVNFSKSDGVLSIDLNVDHVAWTDVSKDGNYIDSGAITFKMKNHNSGYNDKLLERVAIDILKIAVQKNKPIVQEDLKITIGRLGSYESKKANFKKNIFAYRKLSDSITSRANKDKVDIIKVNPAFTSIIGKIKYMRKYGLSIHESAAFAIGRRGLGYEEKIPKVFLENVKLNEKDTNWKQWSTLNKLLDIPIHSIYKLYNINKPSKKLNTMLPEIQTTVRKKIIKNLI